jgi:hypothetical protein
VSAALRFIYLLALAVWIGEVVFFSFGVAPTLFRQLGPVAAGEAVGAVFPRYYAMGMACAGVALVGALALGRGAAAAGRWRIAALAIAIGLAATVWAGLVVQPRARRARPAAIAGEFAPPSEEFRRAHSLAVTLNVVALLGGLVGLACSASALRH